MNVGMVGLVFWGIRFVIALTKNGAERLFSRRFVRSISNYIGFRCYPLQHDFESLTQPYPNSSNGACNSYFLAINFLSDPVFAMYSMKNVSARNTKTVDCMQNILDWSTIHKVAKTDSDCREYYCNLSNNLYRLPYQPYLKKILHCRLIKVAIIKVEKLNFSFYAEEYRN